MRTTLSRTSAARACVILSLLLCVEGFAANARQPRVRSQDRTPAHPVKGVSDPCAARPTPPAETGTGETSEASVPLAKLLDRTRAQTKALDGISVTRRPVVSSQTNADQSGSLSQNLWSSRIEAPETPRDAEDSLALKRLIRQVRSVKFAGKDAGPTFTAPDESQPATDPFEANAAAATTGQPTGSTAATAVADASASQASKAQKTLDTLQQNPDQVRDPLEMGELLFLSGRPAEAAPFYAKALDRINRVDPSYDADRAWILFQLGNCLRETDASKAQETYMKLVSEYPESPWTELAKAHGRMLTWYQKSRSGPVAAVPPL